MLDRRVFLLGAAATALSALVGAACRDGGGEAPSATESTLLIPPGLGEFMRVYPDLSRSGVFLRSYKIFENFSVPTEVYNFTDVPVDFETIGQIYKFLDSGQIKVNFQNRVFVGGQQVHFQFFRKNAAVRVVAFVPSYVSKPDWRDVGLDTSDYGAATRVQADGHILSYVQDVPLMQGVSVADRQFAIGFAVSACNDTYSARFVNVNDKATDQNRNVVAAQQLWCSGVGLAMGNKILRRSYSEYLSVAQQNRALIFDPASYEGLPSFQPIVKR